MPNPALVLETALLILAAFLIGATLGSLAKTSYLRLSRRTAVSVADAPTPAVEAPPPTAALVAAPTIAPLNKPVSPVAPLDIPDPDFASIVQSIAKGPALASVPPLVPLPVVPAPEPASAPLMAPARVAGQATSGRQVPMLRQPAPVAVRSEPDPEIAAVIPFPHDRVSVAAPPAETDKGGDAPPELVEHTEPAPVEASAPFEEAEQGGNEALTETGADPTDLVEALSPNTEADQDEAAAMRAIEGTGSTKRRGNRRRTAPPPAPEVADIDLMVDMPRSDIRLDNGRPDGLPGPRNGVKDNLTNIIGVLPIIETSLNSAGVYHFDQVADFTDENVAWLEQHLGISGRVTREHWREQARELAAASESARKVAGQQS